MSDDLRYYTVEKETLLINILNTFKVIIRKMMAQVEKRVGWLSESRNQTNWSSEYTSPTSSRIQMYNFALVSASRATTLSLRSPIQEPI